MKCLSCIAPFENTKTLLLSSAFLLIFFSVLSVCFRIIVGLPVALHSTLYIDFDSLSGPLVQNDSVFIQGQFYITDLGK